MAFLRTALISTALMAGAAASVSAAPVEGLPLPGFTFPNITYYGNRRSVEHLGWDRFQHPVMMMVIFGGLQPTMTLVEVMPTNNYWSEFLGMMIADVRRGKFIQVADASDKKLWDQLTTEKEFLLAEYYRVYDLIPLNYDSLTQPGSADRILLSKKMGVLMRAGNLDKLLASAYKSLKPGGALIVEDYRATAGTLQDPKAANGYIAEDYAIDTIRKAGFTLADRDDKLLANPNDKRTQSAMDSDRFLLKFVK